MNFTDTLLILLVWMVWILLGLFTAFLALTVDESKGNPTVGYWIKKLKKNDKLIVILGLVYFAPILSPILGIMILLDYCSSE